MPSFLAPLFLLGLAAIAVPLLVHLVERERRDPVSFPSLMFLDRTPAPFTARRQLRDPWLFLLRALAVLALVVAFARPVLGPRPVVGAADARRREVVVLLDRSFSMRVGDRWTRAKAEVARVIASIGVSDRMTLVTFDRRARAVTLATGDRAQLTAALGAITLSDEGTRLAPAVSIALQRLAASDAPRKAVVVVSDFQRSAWDLGDESHMPAGTEVVPVDVAGTAAVVDHAVRSVEVRRDRTGAAERVIVSARLANLGAAARGLEARLEVGGRVVETRPVDLPRDGGATVTFAAVPVPPAPVASRVTLTPDALERDDAFHFLLSRAPVLPVLLIESRPSPYLPRALGIGDEPAFDIVTRTPEGASARDLAGRRLVLLADGAFPSGIGARRLASFVEEGGGLLTALGERAQPRSWPAAARALTPGTMRTATDRAGAHGAVLGYVDRRHPALALFAGPRAGDLAAARFYKYRAIDTTSGILARFDDGTAALTEHAVGRGRVLTFASTFDGLWNDLPRQPVFLPFVHQLARHASSWRPTRRAFDIGASVIPGDIAEAAATGVTRWIATAPSGARTSVGGSGAPVALELSEAGIHELRPGGTPGARPVLVAANFAPAELDFATFDAARLTNALLPAPTAAPVEGAAEAESMSDREARQSTWWYLLLAVALLLAAESVFAWRSGTRPAVVE